MTRKIILGLVAENENQALYATSLSLGKVFVPMGYDHEVIDLFQPDGAARLSAHLKSGNVAFAYGLAGVGAHLCDASGVCLWQAAQTPFACIWYDHPAYNYRQHAIDNPFVRHFYHMQEHLEARQKYLAPHARSDVYLLPHVIGVNPHSRTAAWDGRANQMMYAKTGKDPKVWAQDWDRHQPFLRDILWGLAKAALKQPSLNLTDGALDLFKQAGANAEDLDVFFGVVQEVDAYVRAWRSDQMARALLAHDAVIFGRGWDYLSDQPHRAVFAPPFSAEQLPERTVGYRLCANTNPHWQSGIHERTILGLASGCLTVTDRNPSSDKAFGALPTYCAFSWGEDLADVLRDSFVRAGTEPLSAEENWTFFQNLFTSTGAQWNEAFLRAMGQPVSSPLA